ncbi:MAG: hypothetical protein RIG62_24380 [Cyclobacteriaceae bacterium]
MTYITRPNQVFWIEKLVYQNANHRIENYSQVVFYALESNKKVKEMVTEQI